MKCFVCALALAVMLVGCVAPRSKSPYADQNPEHRSPAEAERLTLRAAAVMDSDPAAAHDLLRQALVMDIFHGPAHNNLGVLHLRRGELDLAAQEFEWARKLIPGSPDPRVNLALALEHAGHTEEALEVYATALEVMPEYVPAIQGLACLQLRTGRADPQLDQRLQTISLKGESQLWRSWAHAELVKREGVGGVSEAAGHK